MASLAPPPINRNRASSTNIRPALTLNSLGRRRSNSDLPPLDQAPSLPPSPVVHMQSRTLPPLDLDISAATAASSPAKHLAARATFVELYNRVMDLLRVANTKQADSYLPAATSATSSPISPRLSLSRSSTSTEETLLPITSPSVATFVEAYGEKPSHKSTSSSSSWWHGSPSVHTPVFFVIALFPLSTALLFFCMATLPVTQAWPRSITDLAQLGRELHGYSQSGTGPLLHVTGVLSVVVAWNHAWSIPGSVLWNVLAGALFSPVFATLLLTALTTVGSIFASLLSAPLAPFLVKLFPRALEMTRNAIEGSSASSSSEDDEKHSSSSTSSAWVRLSILRLIGIVPWSGINVACGVCGVALYDCVLGSFIGSLPWTAVTCQIGDILQTVASSPTPGGLLAGNGVALGERGQTVQDLLTSPEIVAKLVFLSFLSLAPILGRDRLKALVSRSERSERSDDAESVHEKVEGGEEESRGRWAWVREWREKIRVPSRSRARQQRKETWRREVEVLVREKESLPL